jgi:YbbR domain-containing protein
MYKKARKEVLRKIKKTGKMPKDATLEKYELKNSEIKEVYGRGGTLPTL